MNNCKLKFYQLCLQRTINSADKILVCGYETGILAILAARHGSQVTVWETGKYLINQYKKAIAKTYYCDCIRYQKTIDSEINVIILSPANIKIVNYLVKNNILTSATKVIPNKIVSFVEFVHYSFTHNQIYFPAPTIINNLDSESYSESQIFNEINLTKTNKEVFCREICFLMKKSGVVNALQFSTVENLIPEMFFGNDSYLLVPLDSVIPVEKDQLVTLKIVGNFSQKNVTAKKI